ncbi:MAG: Uma2 family endonuclease, partial [Cyanophyceae cyanobacterium]
MLDHPFPITLPPTQDELPCDDGVPMETGRHRLQMELLINSLDQWLSRQDVFVGGNMFLYYSLAQVKNQDFKGPDVFVALDVAWRERKSWVVWEEGKPPDIVIELLSDSTRKVDKQEKKQIYQDRVRVAEYYWYDPFNSEDFAGFILQGSEYTPLPFDSDNNLTSPRLDLKLVRWQGVYHRVDAVWLRWATLAGELLPTDEELAEQERQRAQQAQQQAEQAHQQAEQDHQQAAEAQQVAELGLHD